MGRAPCCDKANVKRGPWSPEEDAKLKDYIDKYGTGGNWIALPTKAGLRRCGKSCRLRWLNYLRPNIKHGEFTDDEDRIICSLFSSIGSRWSIIAAQLPGRTDNDIKNYWNTKLKKKLLGMTTPSNQNQTRPHLPFPLPLTSNNIYNHSLMQSYSNIPSQYSSINPHVSPPYESGNSNYYPTMAFSTLTSPPSLLQAQGGCLGPTQISNKGNFLIFGGEAASCTSSDGSCTTNHVSQGRDQVEQDYGENLGLQSYFSNGVGDTQKLLVGYGGGDEKAVANGCYSENPLDYSIEEIKQLISTNNVCSNNLNFFVDEIKTEEKEIYY